MTLDVFNAAIRSAASLLILTAAIGSTAGTAFAALAFEPAPLVVDRSVDTARAWYDHDFDALPPVFDRSGDPEHLCAKAWYDRDFDIPDESEGHSPGTSTSRGFDGLAPG